MDWKYLFLDGLSQIKTHTGFVSSRDRVFGHVEHSNILEAQREGNDGSKIMFS